MSVNFHIPDFWNNKEVHRALFMIMHDFPEYFYKDINIASSYGVPGYCIWNGGRNDSYSLYPKDNIKDIIDMYNNHGTAVRFTFTNSNIEEKHLYDTYCNMVLEQANNGKNDILVNSPVLEKYLRENYPNFKYIASTTKCERDIDKINEMTEQYDLVVIDFRDNHDMDFLNKIKHKDKIELLVNEICGEECPRRKNHYDAISKEILHYNDESKAFYINSEGKEGCPYQYKSLSDTLKNNPCTIKKEEIFGEYSMMGFKHFKIEGRKSGVKWCILSYMNYMVKPEYYIDFLEKIIPLR